jgi:hypothetical protein
MIEFWFVSSVADNALHGKRLLGWRIVRIAGGFLGWEQKSSVFRRLQEMTAATTPTMTRGNQIMASLCREVTLQIGQLYTLHMLKWIADLRTAASVSLQQVGGASSGGELDEYM